MNRDSWQEKSRRYTCCLLAPLGLGTRLVRVTLRRGYAVGVCLVLVCHIFCRPAPPIPPLPHISGGSFPSPLRDEIRKLAEEARGNPGDAGASGRLGMLLHAHGQYASAEACYLRAVALDRRTASWSYYLARTQLEQGKNAVAVNNLRKALELDPSYTPARLKLAEALLAAGDLLQSEAEYRRVLDRAPGSIHAHYGLGRVLAAKGDFAAAAASLAKACELNPRFGAAHYALGQAYGRLGDAEKSRAHLELSERSQSLQPPLDDPWMAAVYGLKRSAHDLLREGRELAEKGRLDEAIATHLRALEGDPRLTQAHVNLISLYGRLGKLDEALKHYQAALKLNADLADCHYNYGVLMFEAGRRGEAKLAFSRALKINPHYAEARHNLGYLLEEEGRLREAEAHYREAIADKPDHRLAHFHLGRLLVNRKDYQAAIAHFRKTLSVEDERTASFLYALGAAYARSGDRERAIEHILLARERAASYGQAELLARIERDLETLSRRVSSAR